MEHIYNVGNNQNKKYRNTSLAHWSLKEIEVYMMNLLTDDFSNYAAWKANILKYKIYQNLANETMSDIEDRLR